MKKEDVLAGAEVSLTILVAKDSLGKAVFANVVPQKGVDADHYAVDVLMEDIGWLGYTALSLRSDNEPAILKLLRHAVTEARIRVDDLNQVMTEHPNTYDHAGNGEIENAVKQVIGILRTNKLDLEKRIGKEIPLGHPVVTWLVEYAREGGRQRRAGGLPTGEEATVSQAYPAHGGGSPRPLASRWS